ncbi:hypothetical protein ACRAWD_01970 [Caulobacter segnis]
MAADAAPLTAQVVAEPAPAARTHRRPGSGRAQGRCRARLAAVAAPRTASPARRSSSPVEIPTRNPASTRGSSVRPSGRCPHGRPRPTSGSGPRQR